MPDWDKHVSRLYPRSRLESGKILDDGEWDEEFWAQMVKKQIIAEMGYAYDPVKIEEQASSAVAPVLFQSVFR